MSVSIIRVPEAKIAPYRGIMAEIEADEQELMARALEENSVIVAQVTPFFDKA